MALQICFGPSEVGRGDQLRDAGEAAVRHHMVGQLAEEALDESQPRGAGGVK